MVGMTQEIQFKILIYLNLNCHVWLVATILNSADLECKSLWGWNCVSCAIYGISWKFNQNEQLHS